MLLDKGYAIQGGVKNFLGETEEVTAPKFWQSSENSPPTELSYITDAEKELLLKANLHGSLVNNKPNIGAAGILSFDGWGDASDGFGNAGETSSDSGFGGSGNDNNNNNYSVQDDMTDYATNVGKQAAVGGGFVGDNNNNDGSNNYTVPDPVLPPGVISQNFDYETNALQGSIESSFYNPETGQVSITQTPGAISAEQYQTANLEAYLNSNAVSDEDKIDTLNQLQALSNSNLKGSKLSNIEEEFVVGNLDSALENVKDRTKYSKYTSSIDEDIQTFSKDASEDLLGTVTKSGGFFGTMVRGVSDTFKNNQALGILGYTGSTIRNTPEGFTYSQNYLTGNVGGDERDAMNRLTPLASNVVGNTTPSASMVNTNFANLQENNIQTAYAQAKENLNMILAPTNTQFGYSASPYGLFTRADLTNNPFNIQYLQDRGLI